MELGEDEASGADQDGQVQHRHDDPPVLLDAAAQPRFVNDLPLPRRLDVQGAGAPLVLEMRQSEQWLGLVDSDGHRLTTPIWGFGPPGEVATTPGPTIIARSGVPIEVEWRNALPATGHLLPVDMSIHHAMTASQGGEDGAVPTVVHLHGGHTAAESDGHPDAWFTQGNGETGPAYTTDISTYDNDQGATALWYHDHALGLARLNVGAGLAGFYLLRDAQDDRLAADGVLPSGHFEVEAAIQDRAFTADGRPYLPAHLDDPIPGSDDGATVAEELPEGGGAVPHPSVLPEFFGDVLLVNGMAWPKLEVEPGQYRLHLLNGSDSRFYVLRLDDPSVKATLVGTDGGLLPEALAVSDGDGVQEPGERLVLAPADRVDLVLDFSGAAGRSVTLLNDGPAFEPFKGLEDAAEDEGGADLAGNGTDRAPVGEVMRFDVADAPALRNATVEPGTALDAGFRALSVEDAGTTRKVGLFEGADEHGRVLPLLGVAEDTVDAEGNPVPFGPLQWHDPVTEAPRLGATEVWEIYNFTEDAHPVHLHLVRFQVLGRQGVSFVDEGGPDGAADGVPDDTTGDGHVRVGEDVLLDGAPRPLAPEDTGWQDTAWVAPGEVLRIAATFDRPGDYVWHCHILSHEDHDMMRPLRVVADDGW